MIINSIKNLNNNVQLNFTSKLIKKDDESRNTKLKETTNNTISAALISASSIGIATIAMSSRKKLSFGSGNDIADEMSAKFKNGLAYNADGKLFTGELVKKNSLGEKYNIEIKDGIIQQSTKTDSNGKIVFVKKYSRDKFQNKITDIFTPTESGKLEQTKRILTSKDKMALFKGTNTVNQYWFKTPSGFKRIDKFIDKGDIENHMSPIDYYAYNGIQINRFLREGEFKHPDIRVDRIHYEYLTDPECPEHIKNHIRKIMRDNRFLLSAIDDLDALTHTSTTKAPMTVYRNAPRWWIDKAKDGILTDSAFCSTSTEKGASIEGLYIGKDARDGVTYAIHLPKGTPFFDATDTSEKEMLLPRNGRFRVINPTELEYIL